jgi:hypothetical protein
MSAAKKTSLDWPDPTDWVNRLHQAMAERQAVYDAESDSLLKRNKASGGMERSFARL